MTNQRYYLPHTNSPKLLKSLKLLSSVRESRSSKTQTRDSYMLTTSVSGPACHTSGPESAGRGPTVRPRVSQVVFTLMEPSGVKPAWIQNSATLLSQDTATLNGYDLKFWGDRASDRYTYTYELFKSQFPGFCGHNSTKLWSTGKFFYTPNWKLLLLGGWKAV